MAPLGDSIRRRWITRPLRYAGIAAAVFISLNTSARAQDSTRPFVAFGGSATLTAEAYGMSADPWGAEPARRPPSLARLVLSPTLTLGDAVTLPFSIILTSRETNVTTPLANNPTFAQFVQNPANAIGFLSFAPKVEWAQAYIGSHTPQFSELTAGDEQIFGFGVDLTPGIFRVAASTGISQRAIEPDSAAGIRGAYRRRLTMAKIGVGTEEGSYVYLNAVRADDDTTSIARRPEGVDPQTGVAASANFRIGITEKIYITGEAAASGFTRDTRAEAVDREIPIPKSVLDARTSTRLDVAGTMAFVMKADWWDIRAMTRYLGPGFVPIGFPFMQSDRLEFSVAPAVRLFENNLALSGSIGTRTNNLSETKGATSTQLTASLNAQAVITDALSLSARFANFGMRNNVANDTLKVENVARSFELSPTYTISGESAEHSITLSYALDAYTDYNTVTGREGSNNTQNIMGIWTTALTGIPLSANATVGYMTNDLPLAKFSILSASLGLGYRLLDGRLLPSIGVSHSRSRVNESAGEDLGMLLRLGVQWNATESITLSATASTNAYEYGATRSGARFRENLLETSLSTQF